MRRHLKKIRKSKITKEELVADAIFLAIPAVLTFLIVFLFDIHHSFYEWPIRITFIFHTPYPYMLFTPFGMLFGFFVIKILLFGFKEEEKGELKSKRMT